MQTSANLQPVDRYMREPHIWPPEEPPQAADTRLCAETPLEDALRIYQQLPQSWDRTDA